MDRAEPVHSRTRLLGGGEDTGVWGRRGSGGHATSISLKVVRGTRYNYVCSSMSSPFCLMFLLGGDPGAVAAEGARARPPRPQGGTHILVLARSHQ